MARVKVVETNLRFTGPLPERPATNCFMLHHISGLTRDVTPEEVHGWHINERRMLGIAYHYLVSLGGTIYRGRPRAKKGAHCDGHNWEAIGICLAGDFNKKDPTEEQLKAVTGLLAELCEIYGKKPGPGTIVGHRDLDDTDCPGDRLYARIPEIRERVAACL